jgi:GT2 family glycosyltransferase
MASMTAEQPDRSIGAIVVAFNSAEVICECLESLLAQEGCAVRVVVVENASTDATAETIRDWARGRTDGRGQPLLAEEDGAGGGADAQVILLHSGANRGFAGGVNLGLARLARAPEVRHFWVINPDAFADRGSGRAILAAATAMPGYGLMGGRVCYAEPPHRIQIDGGLVNLWTGVSGNFNLGREPTAPLPRPQDLDFITGANLVASRAFYEAVGPMREDYFLYYEEADWALRRGTFPLAVAPGFTVYHHAGTSIGSPTLERLASPFSFWFKYRSRMKFVRRFNPLGLPVAVAFATAKALQLALKGALPQAATLLRAVYGLPAPKAVRDRLSPDAARIAFGKPR